MMPGLLHAGKQARPNIAARRKDLLLTAWNDWRTARVAAWKHARTQHAEMDDIRNPSPALPVQVVSNRQRGDHGER